MDEITSIYILKNFEESLKNGSFWIKNKYFIVEANYIEPLLTIFSISNEVATATFNDIAKKLGYKLFILNYKTIVRDLAKIELTLINKPSNLKKDFVAFVLELLDKVIKRKLECVPLQKYADAGFYRDIELDLKRIYFPSMLKTNDVSLMNNFIDAVKSVSKGTTLGISSRKREE